MKIEEAWSTWLMRTQELEARTDELFLCLSHEGIEITPLLIAVVGLVD